MFSIGVSINFPKLIIASAALVLLMSVDKFQLSKNEVNSILSYAHQIGFTYMQDEYYEPISDLPTTYIRIREKQIKDYVGAPKELKILEELIDKTYLKAITE